MLLNLCINARDALAARGLDVSMPKMSGQEVLVELMGIDPAVRVVIFSGLETDRAQFAGARAFMQKPLRPAAIAQTVREVLDA